MKNLVDISYNDIPEYSGFCPDCPLCGHVMGYSHNKSEFKCPSCNYILDEYDWFYEDPDEIPYVCGICGGPYPSCTSSCKMFDD